MNDQIILVVDDQGNFSGEYMPKSVGHRGEGRRHLAITVLLVNSQGQVLLQKRKHKMFDHIWDITGATHPLHVKDGPASPDGGQGGTDESLEEATWRCLEVEYGIEEKIPLKNLGFFNYFAKYGEYCENEHCAILIGEYNGPLDLNPEVGYEYKWMDKTDFLKDIEKNPKNYTPWAVKGTKILQNNL